MLDKFAKKQCYILGSLILVAFAPLIFKSGSAITSGNADVSLTVISPYSENIRREFARSFQEYYQQKKGKKVYINWLNPGGPSEIKRVIDEKFINAEKDAGIGIGIDVFFGGGAYDYKQQASYTPSRLQKLDVFQTNPRLFTEDVIPSLYTGEVYYDQNHYWVGTCLSQFGICYNKNTVARLGVDPPESWEALGDPKLIGAIALADPQKSGSMAKAFEMLIQQNIHRELSTIQPKTAETPVEMRDRGIRIGWAKGLNLIQRISANTRYFTDSSAKIPLDVAQGDAAAGMCVDFYGRAYNEKHLQEDGSSRLEWVAPQQGTSVSVDPVAVFRGAPQPELAQEFVEFLLSERGQLLWNVRAGTKYGPEYRSLRRLPIRKDMYTKDRLARFADAAALPYVNGKDFQYNPEYTESGFGAMRLIIRVMCIDVHDELVEAWEALIAADFPERATHHFHDVAIVSYEKTMGEIREQIKSGKKLETLGMRKRLASVFRRNYQQTVRLAAQER